jgi:hypothetical protein
MKRNDSILAEAAKVVNGPRRSYYGTPLVNHSRTAAFWTAYLGIPITAEQVCILNILQKCARSMNTMTRDTLVDIAGYAENIHLIEAARVRRNQ